MQVKHKLKAPFYRRFLASCYDMFLCVGVLIIGTYLFLLGRSGKTVAVGDGYYQIYLGVILLGLTLWFSMQGGQTPGMKAWQLTLKTDQNTSVSFRVAFLRRIIATVTLLCAGLGWLWMLIDRERNPLYDRLLKVQMLWVK